MPGGKITLYVDIVSPFAYMGYYYLRVGVAHWRNSLSRGPFQLRTRTNYHV